MRIADFSIRRPVFAVMLIGSLVVLGLVSLGRLGTDLFPRIEFPFMAVTTLLVGATPETVESEIRDPIEEQLNTIGGVEELRSVSSEASRRCSCSSPSKRTPTSARRKGWRCSRST